MRQWGSAILGGPMKKLPIAVAFLSLSIAAPVFACPNHEDAARTAEQAPAAKETAKADKAQAAKPADKAKPAEKAKDAKPADKVSQK
jgi:hypothetical protein